MVRQRKPASQTWRTFLENHVKELVSTDLLVVPTVNFRVLFVLVVLAHHRRHAIHFNVTAHPTAEWTAQQIAEAFPWDSAPRYLLRHRNSVYGTSFLQRVREMGINEVVTTARNVQLVALMQTKRIRSPTLSRFVFKLHRMMSILVRPAISLHC